LSDDTILAALTRLETGQAILHSHLVGRMDRFEAGLEALADRLDRLAHEQQRQGAVLDRTESKVDKLAAEVSHLGPRVSALESDFAGHYTRSATASNRIDALDVRLSLIERRLEVRDQPPPV